MALPAIPSHGCTQSFPQAAAAAADALYESLSISVGSWTCSEGGRWLPILVATPKHAGSGAEAAPRCHEAKTDFFSDI